MLDHADDETKQICHVWRLISLSGNDSMTSRSTVLDHASLTAPVGTSVGPVMGLTMELPLNGTKSMR